MGLRDTLNQKFGELSDKVTHHQPAPAPAQSTAGPSTPSSSTTKKKTTKRGLCWPVQNTDPVHLFTKPPSKISWLYNWSPHPTPNASSLDFVPMQWNHINIGELPQLLDACGATALLGFNEPELDSQSNIPVEVAAQQWVQHVEPLRREKGLRAGSIGISNAGWAVQYLREWLRLIREGGSDVDFYCVHWYGPDLGPFYDYIWSTHHQLGADKPMWITEFACTNWNERDPLPREQVERFARESVKYLDTLDWVERYCWYAPKRDVANVGVWCRMLDDEGRLTDLGRAYRDE